MKKLMLSAVAIVMVASAFAQDGAKTSAPVKEVRPAQPATDVLPVKAAPSDGKIMAAPSTTTTQDGKVMAAPVKNADAAHDGKAVHTAPVNPDAAPVKGNATGHEGHNHGAVVSDVAKDTPSGAGKGQVVSATAKDNAGATKNAKVKFATGKHSKTKKIVKAKAHNNNPDKK
jgi:hypothetical protein